MSSVVVVSNSPVVDMVVPTVTTKPKTPSVPVRYHNLMAFAHWLLPQLTGVDVAQAHELLKYNASNVDIIAHYAGYEANIDEHVQAFKTYQKETKKSATQNKKTKPPTQSEGAENAPVTVTMFILMSSSVIYMNK